MSKRADDIRDRIEAEVTAPLGQLDLDVEAVELSQAGKRRVLRIAVDADDGVRHDDLVGAEHAVSEALEATDLMGQQPYTLEVTSRGVDRPLTRPRHWRRNRGRLVAITRAEGATLTGRVTGHDEDAEGGVRLDTGAGVVELAYAEIGTALVQIEFNRPDVEEDA